jgi:antirestriction protein
MEQHHRPIGGFDPTQPVPPSTDERAVQLGIAAAWAEDREVDDAVARAIAAGLHGGQDSALYRFASTGSLEDERLEDELRELYRSRNPRLLEWASVLGTYALHREHKGPVDGWQELWPDRPGQVQSPAEESADPEAEARRSLFDRINAAGVTTLGQVATIHTAEGVYGAGADEHDEPDTSPWTDAARWRPGSGPNEPSGTESADIEIMDELFARLPDAEFGSREQMGWCGLLRHEGRPGGVILHRNPYGRRSAWTTDSDDELAARWQQLQEGHEAYRYARQTRETEYGNEESPHIWVGSLADYNAGHLHGAWLDATLDPGDLGKAVEFVLRNSRELSAEEYGIFDYDNFGHGITSLLGEYASLKVVSKIAQGIAEHGQAYAAWAAYVGPEQEEQLDRFADHYLGEWEDMEAYVRNVLDEIGLYRHLDEALKVIPEDLRMYIDIDTEALARDWEIELHVIEKPDGKVFVFDPRC